MGPITLLKMDVGCPCTAEIRLMGASRGSAFLALVAIMDRLGLKIYWFPFRVGELELLLKIGLGGFNLAVATAVLTSCDVEPSLPVQNTSLRMCATARPVCDNLLRDHRLERIQSLSDSRHILRDKLVNRTDFALDDIWDKPAPR